MQLFKRKAKSNSRVGLAIQSDRLVLAHVDIRKGEPHLLHGRTEALESDKQAGKALAKLVRELDLDGKQASYVLSPDDYNLQLVEAPKVEPDELRAAVRWKVKDLLDMKVEDAAIDVFPVPKEAYRGRDMVYVVAAQKSRVQNLVEMINSAGLEMAVIDIPELVMNNISRQFIEDSNGVAFIDLRRSGSTMNISLAGDMYLTRRINTQLDLQVMDSPDWPSLKDRLVLEIQRSLDYYESQMGRPQITRVVVAQRQHDTRELTRELDELLAAQVSPLNLADYMEGDEDLTPEYQQLALTAIGATLRGLKIPEKDSGPKDSSDSASQEAA